MARRLQIEEWLVPMWKPGAPKPSSSRDTEGNAAAQKPKGKKRKRMSNNLTGMKFMQRKLRADAERAEESARERELSKTQWVADSTADSAGADASGGEGDSRLRCTRFDSDAFDPQVADADAAQWGGGGDTGMVFLGVAGRRSYGGFNGKLEAIAAERHGKRKSSA